MDPENNDSFDVIDLLQDLAFSTGHRIMSTREATKDVRGVLVVQKKGKGSKRIFFDDTTKVFLGPEQIEIDLHHPKSINHIRGFLLSPALYEDALMRYNTAHTFTSNQTTRVVYQGD